MPNKMKEYLDQVKLEGISVTEIIERSRVGRTAFYAIMKGTQIPRLDNARNIANALGKSVEEVFPEEVGENC